jgi:hypothetical protein
MPFSVECECQEGHKVTVIMDESGNLSATVGVVPVALSPNGKTVNMVCANCSEAVMEVSERLVLQD